MPQQVAAYGFDIAPLAEVYSAQFDALQRICGLWLRDIPAADDSAPVAASERIARQFIDTQIELYKLMTHGLEEYKKVLLALPHATSPFEVARLYLGYGIRMAHASATEAKRLAEPFTILARGV